MYHCNLQFYFIGSCHNAFEIFRGIAPLEHFSHIFSHSLKPEAAPLAAADLILAELSVCDDAGALGALTEHKKEGADLILLADRTQPLPPELFALDIRDIWLLPAATEELCFHFQQWQRGCKQQKDFWETRHYLETTINSVPNLVWYKDKTGVHEKVNDSFCKTVGKTKQQVEGQHHAYIWDVAEDDPACIESERIVM